jgi:DNA polymerase, archaea type
MNLWLLSSSYRETPRGTDTILWGRDEQGNVQRVVDSSLMPFFLSTADVDIPTAIKTYETKNVKGNPVEMVRYSFPHPRDIRSYRHLVPPDQLYEADVYFTERYVYSKRVEMSGWNLYDNEGAVTGNVADNPAPDLVCMSLDFEMYNPMEVQPSPDKCPIIMAGIHATTLKEPIVMSLDESEGEDVLLASLETRIREIDPDIIFTYGGSFFDLPYADARAKYYGISLNWGRENFSPIRMGRYDAWDIDGRAHVDLNSLVKQTLAQIHTAAIKPLTLKNVAREYLGIPNPKEMEKGSIARLWDSGQSGRDQIAEYNASDANITLKLGLKLLPFAIALSNLTTLPLGNLFENSRGQQVDHYLMKLATERNEAIPMKPHGETHKRFTGAHITTPAPGLHKNVWVLDFASMYPNILMKLFPNTFLADAARTLLAMRKASVKDSPEQRSIKTIQLAEWGYVGWDGARWKNMEHAQMITATGGAWIDQSIDYAMDQGISVIYGHTDSMFTEGGTREDMEKLASDISKNIGSEIRVDKFYEKLIFVEGTSGEGRINAYIGIDEKGKLDARGLDLIRGDTSQLGQVAQEGAARIVLYRDDLLGAKKFIRHLIKKTRSDGFPIKSYIIRKSINVDAPRVMTAQLAVAQRIGFSAQGQIEYVISDVDGALNNKARHPSELKHNGHYLTDRIDKDYYIRKQIIPPALRILKMFGIAEDELLIGRKSVSLDRGVS